MAFTHALSTNNYGPYKFVVSSSAALGTHTTIQSAINDASSGDVIFLRDSAYTENLTLAAGVTIASTLAGSCTITGKVTASYSGSASIRNITISNTGDNCIVLSGSNATTLTLTNCGIISSGATAISYTSSNSSSLLQLSRSFGDTSSAATKFFDSTSAGILALYYFTHNNTSGSTTASTISAGTLQIRHSFLKFPITTSSSVNVDLNHTDIDCNLINTTPFTHNATSGTSFVEDCSFNGGNTTAFSVGAGATIGTYNLSAVSSSGTKVSNSGTINNIPCYQAVSFANGGTTAFPTDAGQITLAGGTGVTTTGSANTVTVAVTGAVPLTITGDSGTVTPSSNTFKIAGTNGNVTSVSGTTLNVAAPAAQAAFSAYLPSTVSNVIGNGANFTLGTTTALTEIFDVGNNFVTSGTFTAPVTGKYLLLCRVLVQGCTIASSISLTISTTARTYSVNYNRGASASDLGTTTSQLCDMTAGDTATFIVSTGGEVANTDDVFGGAGTSVWTGVSGFLVST